LTNKTTFILGKKALIPGGSHGRVAGKTFSGVGGVNAALEHRGAQTILSPSDSHGRVVRGRKLPSCVFVVDANEKMCSDNDVCASSKHITYNNVGLLVCLGVLFKRYLNDALPGVGGHSLEWVADKQDDMSVCTWDETIDSR